MQNNDDINIQDLVNKYENMLISGKKIYFDADEFAMLTEYYMSMDDNMLANEIIEEGLKIHPGNTALTVLKAKVLVDMDLYEEALMYLDNISDDEDSEIALIKIEAMFQVGRDEEANELISNTIANNLPIEDLYIFITELGFIMNDIENYSRAIYYFEQSLKIDESNIEVFIDLAFSYEMMSDYENAIKYNNRLLDLNPYSYDGWVNLGKLYSLNEQYDLAISAFDFANTINEGDVDTLKMKALSLFLNDNASEAIATFKECIKLNPDDVSIYDSIIEGYESLEQYDDMLSFIDIKEERFGSEGIVIKRAFVELLRDNIARAWDLYYQVPEEEKETLDYYILEGELFFISENLRASEAAYIKAALLSENDVDIIDRLANVNVAQEKYEQAANYLEQLLRIDPDFPTAKARLAFIRFEIGVKEPFDKVMEQFSDDELRDLLEIISGSDSSDLLNQSREKLLIRINEARENRVLFKNIKY